MSALAIIQKALLRKKRLNQAQYLMAKAYRGVKTSDTPDSCPLKLQSLKTYRGVAYTS